MRVCFLIDSIDSGGAQRQMCTLAALLKKRGFEISLYYYRESEFFLPFLCEHAITVRRFTGSSRLRRAIEVVRTLRKEKPDVVIAFLNTACVLAEVARGLGGTFQLIVSERSYSGVERFAARAVRLNLHRFANFVVANSKTQFDYVAATAPWLAERLHWVPNCVDLDIFQSNTTSPNSLRILVIARYVREKNPLGLVKAAAVVRHLRPDIDFVIEWHGENWVRNGHRSAHSDVYFRTKRAIEAGGLSDIFHLHGRSHDAPALYQRSSVVCMPSFYEGMSNVICEAMASGKPILASRVCDNPHYVVPGHNGFLFDPHSAEDIAATLIRYYDLPKSRQIEMGERSRKVARALFHPDHFADRYMKLLSGNVDASG